MSEVKAVPGAFRAKLVPRDTPRGLPHADKTPIYGDRMTWKIFEGWATEANNNEIGRLGGPSYRRTLVEDLDVVRCADGLLRAVDP